MLKIKTLIFASSLLSVLAASPSHANFVILGGPTGYDVKVVNAVDVTQWQPIHQALLQAHGQAFKRFNDSESFRLARREGRVPSGILESNDRVLIFLNKDSVTSDVKEVLLSNFLNLKRDDLVNFNKGVTLAAIEYGINDTTVTLGLMRPTLISDETIIVDIAGRTEIEMPEGSQLLTEREVAQGGIKSVNTIVQVPMSLDSIMEVIALELEEAGESPEIISAGDRNSITIVEREFRLAIAFETISEAETVVLFNITLLK